MNISILILKGFLEQKKASLKFHSKKLIGFKLDESRAKQFVVETLNAEIKDLKKAIQILEANQKPIEKEETIGSLKHFN